MQSKTNMRKSITRLKIKQGKYVAIQKAILKEIASLEKTLVKYVQKRWDASFPGVKVHFLPGLQGGCLAANWKADGYFYTVDGLEHYAGKWYEFNENYSAMKRVKPKIPTKKLRRFLAELSEETGVKWILSNSALVEHRVIEEFDEVGSF